MLPGWEPQNVRFWKSQGKVAKSPPIETRPNFQLIRLSKYFCSNHIWVRRTVWPRPQTSCTSWKRAELGIVHQVAAGARGIGDLDHRVFQADDALEIEGGADRDLVGVVDQLLGAAAEIVGGLADMDELEVHALVEEPVAPLHVAEHASFGGPSRNLGAGGAMDGQQQRESQSQRRAQSG